MKNYYFFDRLFDQQDFYALKNEAFQMAKDAKPNFLISPNIKNRGGAPARKYNSTIGGKTQKSIYQSTLILEHLELFFNEKLIPSGSEASYSYYCEKDDFLGIHRDIQICDLTLITCLHSNIPPDSYSGQLYIYDQRSEENINEIYKNPSYGYDFKPLKEGQSILIKGGILPHAVYPIIEDNHQRIISAMCFKSLN